MNFSREWEPDISAKGSIKTQDWEGDLIRRQVKKCEANMKIKSRVRHLLRKDEAILDIGWEQGEDLRGPQL